MQEGWPRDEASQPAVLTSGVSWTLSDSDEVPPNRCPCAQIHRMPKSRLRPGFSGYHMEQPKEGKMAPSCMLYVFYRGCKLGGSVQVGC